MTAVKRTVSVVPTVKTTECEPIEADAIIKGVISGAWRQEIGQIRDNFNANYSDDHDGKAAKKAISGLKQKLPAVMWAGHFEDRKKGGGKLLQHSGLLCLDLDGFDPDKAVSLVKLKRHRSIYSVFKSPSGNGVKVIFRVPQKEDIHDCAWKAAVQETENLTGAKVDVATKNIASLCFVSHDPDAHFNPEAEELNVPKPTSAPLVMKCESTDELPQRKNIAERILRITKWESETVGFCKCPGIEMHTGKNQPQDCRVSLDGVPTIHCFHDSCGSRVEEANRRLRSDIGKAEAASGDASRGTAKRWFILPGTDSLSITESSERIFGVIGPTKTLFQRGGLVVEKVQDTVGTAALAQVKPAAFRSRLESYGHTVGAYRVANGLPVLKSTPCPEDMAKALMETIAARTMLPKISAVLRRKFSSFGWTTPSALAIWNSPPSSSSITAGWLANIKAICSA